MDIFVRHIEINDTIDKIVVSVDFSQMTTDYEKSASVTVYLPNRDASISEIKRDAIQAAFDFLNDVLAAHSDQSRP